MREGGVVLRKEMEQSYWRTKYMSRGGVVL
jgi:hypothetical protein